MSWKKAKTKHEQIIREEIDEAREKQRREFEAKARQRAQEQRDRGRQR